jgi:hypothetical protein
MANGQWKINFHQLRFAIYHLPLAIDHLLKMMFLLQIVEPGEVLAMVCHCLRSQVIVAKAPN